MVLIEGAGLGVAVLGGAVAIGSVVVGPRQQVLRSVQVRFGTDVTEEQVRTMLTLCSGLSEHRVGPAVVLDTIAETSGIRYVLHAPQSVLDGLRSQLGGAMPSLRMDPVEMDAVVMWRHVVRARLTGRLAVLRSDGGPQTAAALLGALGPLAEGEAVMVRWRLAPGRAISLPHPRRDKDQRPMFVWRWLAEPEPSMEQLKAARGKFAGPVLHGEALIATAAGHSKRAAHLGDRVVSVLRSRSTPHGRLRLQYIRPSRVERMLEPGRRVPVSRFSPSELAPLVGWPVDAPQVAGLSLGAAPLLMPAARIPSTGAGRVLATATWPGMTDRRLVQPVEGALSHSLLLGPTGVGKSALMTNLVAQDIAQGRGALLIDMKGDTASDVLARVPQRRLRDVIVLDPASGLPPVPGLRVFGDGDPELVADMLLATFRGLFKDSWGVRSDQYLRQAFVTLAHDPSATLADLIYLFNDAGYRQRLVGRLEDPMLQATWAAYEAMKPGEQAQHLQSPLRKINEVVGRRVVRAVLAQSRPRFDMHQVLAHGKIVVVSLSAGRLSEPAAQLLGALVVYQLYSAVLARQAIPETARTPFSFYLDEAKVLSSGTPIPLDAAFELFRGMGCSITLAGQAITQLPKEVQRAALTNASSLVAFRQNNRADAELLSRELSSVSAEGLQHLRRFEIVARIGLGSGDVAPVTTGLTLPPSPAVSDPDEVRRVSAACYGVDPAEVDRQLRQRHQSATPVPDDVEGGDGPDAAGGSAPVGRRRRAA